jgi:hypothetical protein
MVWVLGYVGGIRVAVGGVVAIGQEIQFYRNFAGLGVGNAAYKPVVSLAPGQTSMGLM